MSIKAMTPSDRFWADGDKDSLMKHMKVQNEVLVEAIQRAEDAELEVLKMKGIIRKLMASGPYKSALEKILREISNQEWSHFNG